MGSSSIPTLNLYSNFQNFRSTLNLNSSIQILRSQNSRCLRRQNLRYEYSFGVRCSLKSSTLPSRVVPWLMLPPVFEDGGDMIYKFFNLEKGIEEYLPKRKEAVVDLDQIPPDDAKFVGSSNGWLASLDQNSNLVFISNPISGQHIRLPSIDTLPDPDINLVAGRGSVSHLILSCSPGEDDCRAMVTYGPLNRLAFCVSGISKEWTPLGEAFEEVLFVGDEAKVKVPYEDFEYCSKWNVLTTISPFKFKLGNGLSYEYLSLIIDNAPPHATMSDWNILNPCIMFPPYKYPDKEMRFGRKVSI